MTIISSPASPPAPPGWYPDQPKPAVLFGTGQKLIVTPTERFVRSWPQKLADHASGAAPGGNGESELAIRGAIAALGIEARRIEDLAERFKDRPEGITLHSIAARMRTAQRRLEEGGK